jgi:hypothetical protein
LRLDLKASTDLEGKMPNAGYSDTPLLRKLGIKRDFRNAA